MTRTEQMQRRLLKAQELAAGRIHLVTSPEAATLFDIIVRTAALWAFAPAAADDLQDIADSLVRLFMAAETFERVGV